MHRLVQNFTPESYATKQLSGKRKRNRQPLSCRPCRLRKVACDREQPCNNCTKQRTLQECVYGADNESETDQVFRTGAPAGHHAGLQNGQSSTTEVSNNFEVRMEGRMERLEYLVETLASKVIGIVDSPGPRRVSSVTTLQSTSHEQSVELKKSVQVPEQANIHSKGVFAMKQPGVVYYIGTSGYTMSHHHNTQFLYNWREEFVPQWASAKVLQDRFTGWQRQALLDCGLNTSLPQDWEATMLQMVPDRETCEILVKRFLMTLNATFPIVDTDSFQAEVATFFEQKQARSTMWLALLISVLAMGWQLPVIPFPPGQPPGPGRCRVHGQRLMSFVQSIAFASPKWTRRPSLLRFQLIMALILAHMLKLDWVDGNDILSGQLGIARRMAFTMGLHRDPRFARRYTVPETELRRKLWLTLNFIDFDHCVQSGMPFTSRESDSDVLAPEVSGPYWLDYSQYCHQFLPLWAKVARLTTSSTSLVTNDELLGLQQSLDEAVARINEPTPFIYGTAPVDKLASLTTRMQRNVLNSLGHRLNLVLNSALLDDPDPSVKMRAARAVLLSSQALLTSQFKLWDAIDEVAEPAREAWMHFDVAMSHCNTYHAADSLLFLIRQGCTVESISLIMAIEPKFDPPALLRTLQALASYQEATLALSPCLVKEHMILSAQVSTAAEHIKLMKGMRVPVLDLSIADGKPIVRIMQQAMDKSIARAMSAVDEALKSDDPPAGLCEDYKDELYERLRQDASRGQQAVSGTQETSAANGLGLLDMDFTLSDWAMDPGLLADLNMDLPWWSAGPI